jgi:hypothetical protein
MFFCIPLNPFNHPTGQFNSKIRGRIRTKIFLVFFWHHASFPLFSAFMNVLIGFSTFDYFKSYFIMSKVKIMGGASKYSLPEPTLLELLNTSLTRSSLGLLSEKKSLILFSFGQMISHPLNFMVTIF